jgi:hypothetical protein
MNKYLEQCEKLSLTARMAIALLIFERYCEENAIDMPQINHMSDYLWRWPLINQAGQFNSWESSRPELVNYGLGDKATKDIISELEKVNIDEHKFRIIVGNLVEILWGSFFGASLDKQSLESLTIILKECNVNRLPILTPFKFSLFSDRDGWGEYITEQDCEFWKNSYHFNLI